MESVLNINVSCFANYNTACNPQTINLLQWCKSDKYAAQQEIVKNESDKEKRDILKGSLLPAITPSGIFTYRSENNLVRHSGVLQGDIDWGTNKHIGNFKELKNEICKISNIAYCGLSVSGNGYWFIIPIAYPEKHKEHFLFIEKWFASLGIVIDPAPKNVASLRGYSYDPEAYFNHAAIPLQNYYQAPKQPTRTAAHTKRNENSIQADVEYLINQLTGTSTDITEGYENWRNIGFALAHEFGESGREYFNQVSSVHPKFNSRETDHQFTKCLQGKGSGVTIKTFYHLCKEVGVLLPEKENTSPNPTQHNRSSVTTTQPYAQNMASSEPVNITLDDKPSGELSIFLDEIILSPNQVTLPTEYGSHVLKTIYTTSGNYDLLLTAAGAPVTESNDTVQAVESYFNKCFRIATIDGEQCLVHKLN